VDDYYLNLLSWSSSNVLAVALANNVYLWNAATNEVSELLQLEQGDCVTSVSWAPGGSHLCVGTDSAAVQLWDASRMALVRSMRGHTARVGSLAWNPVFCRRPLFLVFFSMA
jgi:cell division cycle protein 20 (cofactor of APC complex)